ncbi:MAG: ABC transporter substrate-binding protein [Anaerolineales bacterium]
MIWVAFIFAAAFTLTSCGARDPIRVGFAANLTGANASLGVDGRDGALLALSEVNAEGGIHDRPLELVVRDDLGSGAGALAADQDLIQNEKVFVIIGHMTSGTMMAAWERFQDSGVIFLSPTASTPQLEGKKDNFFRLIVVNSFFAKRLAAYDLQLGAKKAAVFFDADNAAFTDTYRAAFSQAFAEGGGEIVLTYQFSSQTKPDFKPTLRHAQEAQADTVFLAASAYDAALIAQQAEVIGFHPQFLVTNWALTDDFIENGGEAVDGALAVVSHDENNLSPVYQDFQARFIERFGRKPTFAAGYGYEAMMVLAQALRQTDGQAEGLQDALLHIQGFSGVHGEISFDEFGDVSRTLYLMTVREGRFLTQQAFPAP